MTAVVAALLLSGCSAGGGGAAAETTGSPTPTPTPTPTSSPPLPLSPGTKFALEVDELYALVKASVDGSRDHRSSSQVLQALATTVALVRVPPELEPERQRVVDAAEVAAASYRTAGDVTSSVERAAAGERAVQQLRALELVIRTLPGAAPAVP